LNGARKEMEKSTKRIQHCTNSDFVGRIMRQNEKKIVSLRRVFHLCEKRHGAAKHGRDITRAYDLDKQNI
jgi:hypothetical protein